MSPVQVLEAVPNFSVGRDAALVADIADAARAAGADVLDWSLDADHNRSVITWIGTPSVVEAAAVAAARVAVGRIDLRSHRGLHPRIGALDVLPFVPVAGLSMADARQSARRVGERLADELGLPVFYYADASDPPGRPLAALRRGGFEGLIEGWPADREPDVLPANWPHPGAHPTAGAVCVGARPVLLAWNVVVDGVTLDEAKRIAASIRAANGGIAGVRALAFQLASSGRVQISMNLEDAERNSPLQVFRRIEDHVAERGGRIMETEIIGMLPDRLLLEAAADRMKIVAPDASKQLTRRVLHHAASPRSPEQSTE
ncbi:MAG TPA: glutamate formimidoyltransferase [Longimicrobiales bacterium]